MCVESRTEWVSIEELRSIRGYASNTFDLSIVLPRSFTDMAQKIIAVFTRVLQG